MTGPGGVGKSLVIQLIVKVCLKQAKLVQVCGMTGAAASLLDNAITLHAFSGTSHNKRCIYRRDSGSRQKK